MLEKIKEFQVYASAFFVLAGGAVYVANVLSSVDATAAEYKKLQGQFTEFQRAYRRDKDATIERQHAIDRRIDKIQTILERVDRNLSPPRRP